MPEILQPPIDLAPLKKSKKRKGEDAEPDVELLEMRQKAKFHCKDVKEWRVISKYSKTKLEEYLNDVTFLESAQLIQTAGDIGVQVYGLILDKLLKGDGFIQTEITNDVTLKQVMQRELVQYVKLITNRLQILIFSGVNVLNGKKRQREHASLSGYCEPELHRQSEQQSAGEMLHQSGGEDAREWDAGSDRRTLDGVRGDEEKHQEEGVSWTRE